MGQHGSEAFVGLDVAKVHNAVAIADAGRTGEIRYIGEIPNTPEATRKLVAKLTAKYDELHFCYEAGPTGYGLHRCLKDLGQDCIVIAPTSIAHSRDHGQRFQSIVGSRSTRSWAVFRPDR